MSVDIEKAIRFMWALGRLEHPGACLHYVWRAYDSGGADTRLTARTALEAWGKTLGRHPGDRNPPRGAAVWWGRRRRDGDMAGDVVISLGDGRVIATDQPRYGVVGETTIDGRGRLIDREYLGWSDHIFDAPLDLAAPAGDPKPLPTPTPAAPEEEDDMFKPTVHARTEGTPEWALGHPDIGKGLAQYTGPGTGTKKTQGPVTIYRGFMVTADRDIAAAWARTYAHGIGNLTSSTDRAGYIAIQVELSRLATEIG